METKELPEVVEVSDLVKKELVLALMRRRAAKAELGESQSKLERLIEKMDTDGVVKKAIAESISFVSLLQQADAKVNAIISKIQNESGVNLAGYTVNPEDGTFSKPPPVTENN